MGWTVTDDDQLVEALKHLRNGNFPPYGEEEVSRAMTELVKGGLPDRDVLGGYADFILDGWREDIDYAGADWIPAAPDDIHRQSGPVA